MNETITKLEESLSKTKISRSVRAIVGLARGYLTDKDYDKSVCVYLFILFASYCVSF